MTDGQQTPRKQKTVQHQISRLISSLLGFFVCVSALIMLWIQEGALTYSHGLFFWLSMASLVFIGLSVFVAPVLIYLQASRRYGGAMILIAAGVVGVTVWLRAMMVTWDQWGFWGLLIGLLLMGIGIYVVGLLAAVINGVWAAVPVIIGGLAFVLIARIAGGIFANWGRNLEGARITVNVGGVHQQAPAAEPENPRADTEVIQGVEVIDRD